MTTQLNEKQQQWIAIAVLLIVLVANVFATYSIFTKPFPGRNDFFSRWEGARSFWVDGVSPYSDEASLNIQMGIYGRPVIENEDPGLFVYPFYTVIVVAPTVFVDYAVADAIWMVVLEVSLIASMMLLLNLYSWKPPTWLLVGLILWSIMDYFAGRGLFLGNPSHVVYFLEMLAIWALYRQHDSLAGVALAISTLKPQMGYIIIPFLLLWAFRNGRLRFVMSFFAMFVALMLASFILQPDWFGDWVEQVRQYPEYTSAAYPDTGSPVWIVTQYYLGLGTIGEWIVNLLFIAPMLWAWYGVLVERRYERFLWALALSLVVTHLIAIRTATPHFAVFNLIFIFYLNRLRIRFGNWAAGLAALALFVFSWAQFLITVQGRGTLEHPTLFLPLPIGLFIVLWLTRRMWWQDAPRFDLESSIQDVTMPSEATI